MPPVNASRASDIYLVIRRRVPSALDRNRRMRPLRNVVNLERVHGLGGRARAFRGPRVGLDGRHEQFLNAYGAASNTALSRRLARDLAELGYPVDAGADDAATPHHDRRQD